MNKQAIVRAFRLRYSHPSLELPPYFHRLYEPHCSCIHTGGCPCLRCGDIAIACFRAAWLNTDGSNGVLIGSIAHCLAEHSLILRGIDEQSIGWCHHDVGSWMLLLDLPAGISDTWCGIASLRSDNMLLTGMSGICSLTMRMYFSFVTTHMFSTGQIGFNLSTVN